MFIHNLKYTIKSLFKNKVLIFWTFAFPIILGLFFHMAFENIEKDEMFHVFSIALVSEQEFEKHSIYNETFKTLSLDDNPNKLFDIKYTTLSLAEEMLDDSLIKGYIVFENDEPLLVVKENGNQETILKYVLNEISEHQMIVSDLLEGELKKNNHNLSNVDVIVEKIINKINNAHINLKNISKSNLSYMEIEYYTLIAMACMYGGMLGLTALNNCLPNMSNKGMRIAVSPNKKSILVISSTIGAYFVSLVGIFILMLFLLFVLHVDFGTKMGLVILLTVIGDLAGISLGVMISAVFKCSEGAKVGITIAVTMFLSLLSGMMGVTLKYVIDKNVPIINLINPNNLITDGFYSLYYYNTLTRYIRDVQYLIIFIVLCLIISFVFLRREKYDSI